MKYEHTPALALPQGWLQQNSFQDGSRHLHQDLSIQGVPQNMTVGKIVLNVFLHILY